MECHLRAKLSFHGTALLPFSSGIPENCCLCFSFLTGQSLTAWPTSPLHCVGPEGRHGLPSFPPASSSLMTGPLSGDL